MVMPYSPFPLVQPRKRMEQILSKQKRLEIFGTPPEESVTTCIKCGDFARTRSNYCQPCFDAFLDKHRHKVKRKHLKEAIHRACSNPQCCCTRVGKFCPLCGLERKQFHLGKLLWKIGKLILLIAFWPIIVCVMLLRFKSSIIGGG